MIFLSDIKPVFRTKERMTFIILIVLIRFDFFKRYQISISINKGTNHFFQISTSINDSYCVDLRFLKDIKQYCDQITKERNLFIKESILPLSYFFFTFHPNLKIITIFQK